MAKSKPTLNLVSCSAASSPTAPSSSASSRAGILKFSSVANRCKVERTCEETGRCRSFHERARVLTAENFDINDEDEAKWPHNLLTYHTTRKSTRTCDKNSDASRRHGRKISRMPHDEFGFGEGRRGGNLPSPPPKKKQSNPEKKKKRKKNDKKQKNRTPGRGGGGGREEGGGRGANQTKNKFEWGGGGGERALFFNFFGFFLHFPFFLFFSFFFFFQLFFFFHFFRFFFFFVFFSFFDYFIYFFIFSHFCYHIFFCFFGCFLEKVYSNPRATTIRSNFALVSPPSPPVSLFFSLWGSSR